MRFVLLVQLPADAPADPADAARLEAYDEVLTRAGVLLAGDGLHPPAEGVRLEFAAGRCRVLDGPDAGHRRVVGGFWLLQVTTTEEAVEWARRCPLRDGGVIEVRRVREGPADPGAAVNPPARDPGTPASPAGAASRRPRAG
jgi:hypothetical protein